MYISAYNLFPSIMTCSGAELADPGVTKQPRPERSAGFLHSVA
jgi:hypothetical protein